MCDPMLNNAGVEAMIDISPFHTFAAGAFFGFTTAAGFGFCRGSTRKKMILVHEDHMSDKYHSINAGVGFLKHLIY